MIMKKVHEEEKCSLFSAGKEFGDIPTATAHWSCIIIIATLCFRWCVTNMWSADLKATVGQRVNVEGLLFSVSVITTNKQWVMPHVSVRDIRYIDWVALRRKGFEGVVFDKDNTFTAPYSLALWGPLGASVESCKSVFGNNIAVFSNSAGLQEFDPDERKARALEYVDHVMVVLDQYVYVSSVFKFYMASNTCSWVGCDVYLHWYHLCFFCMMLKHYEFLNV